MVQMQLRKLRLGMSELWLPVPDRILTESWDLCFLSLLGHYTDLRQPPGGKDWCEVAHPDGRKPM